MSSVCFYLLSVVANTRSFDRQLVSYYGERLCFPDSKQRDISVFESMLYMTGIHYLAPGSITLGLQ